MIVNIFMGDTVELERNCNHVARLAREHNMQFWKYYEGVFRGLLSAMKGEPQGIEVFKESVLVYEGSGSRVYLALLTVYVGWAALEMALLDKAKELATSAELRISKTSEMLVLPELYRLKAAIALKEYDEQAAEASLREAMLIANKFGSRSFELRAAIDLARLRLQNGDNKACKLLHEVVNTIDEGDCEPYRSDALFLLQT
jgi:hypothetical protein